MAITIPVAITSQIRGIPPTAFTSAVLGGAVINDGGEACQYRFRYKEGVDGEYSYTSWTGSVIVDASLNISFQETISDLDFKSTYYFNAQAKNSAGESDWGNEELLAQQHSPDLDDTPVDGETEIPISSDWAFDHNAAVLSTTVHNNNNYFTGYGNESVIDPVTKQLRIPSLTAIEDPASGLDVSDWYGASGAYRQADADSDATHIQDDDASFPNSINFTLVKWASDAAGTLNTGIGVISVVDSDTLTIEKFTGDDFAASYYYWIKHSEWVVPVTGMYLVKASIVYLPAEVAKTFEVRIYTTTGTSGPVQKAQGIQIPGTATYSIPQVTHFIPLTAGDHLFTIALHDGTPGVPDIYSTDPSHIPLQAFLMKQTA